MRISCGFGFGLVFCSENSDGEGVDTGSHGEHEHSLDVHLVGFLFLVL